MKKKLNDSNKEIIVSYPWDEQKIISEIKKVEPKATKIIKYRRTGYVDETTDVFQVTTDASPFGIKVLMKKKRLYM